MRRFLLPSTILWCGKQNQLDSVNFKQPSRETSTSTSHISFQPKTQEDLQLLQDHIDGKTNIDRDDGEGNTELLDSFWDLKHHVSKQICNTLLQERAQNLSVLEKFLLFSKEIQHNQSFIDRKSRACISKVNSEKTGLWMQNSSSCTIYKQNSVDVLCLQIRSTTKENVLLKHSCHKSVTRLLYAMVDLASDAVKESAKLSLDSKVAWSAAHFEEESSSLSGVQVYSDSSQFFLSSSAVIFYPLRLTFLKISEKT